MSSKTQYAVLGALTIEPASGYEIRRFLAETVGHFWSESFGQIYPVLQRLRAEGLVAATEARTAGGREKSIHRITTEGVRALETWLRSPVVEVRDTRNELLLKLFFMTADTRADVLAQVGSFHDELYARRERFASIESALLRDRAEDAGLDQWITTVRFGIHAAEAQLAWCAETLRRFGVAGRA